MKKKNIKKLSYTCKIDKFQKDYNEDRKIKKYQSFKKKDEKIIDNELFPNIS